MNTYWKKRFSWSKSRQGLLEQCPLAYYFTYIARYEGGSEGGIVSKLLKVQKFIFFKGSLIHNAIRGQITQHCLNRPVSLEAAENFINFEFEKIARCQSDFLSEAYNGFPIEPSILEREKQDSLSQIKSFFSVIWHNYKSLKILTHERLESFQLDGIKVWVQPDLVTKNLKDELIISDWKTGRENAVSIDKDLQLSVYTLWASIYFSLDVEAVGAELVFLKTSQSFPTRRTREQIEGLKNHICEQAHIMLSAKERSEFTPRPNFNICKGCNFTSICSASVARKQKT